VTFKQQTSYTAQIINLEDDDNELKTPPSSENAQLFLSCGLDSLKAKKWYAGGVE
jgi:hypothetical protein